MTEKTYQERLEELFRQSPSVQTAGFGTDSYKPGLEGMRALDDVLGHPWKAYPCIHVAGTNGKGSVCSMLASALSAAGLKVGLYTSPHLLDFRERIKVVREAAEMISKEGVWTFLEDYAGALEGRSFFEVTTAMALWWFARQQVDAAVIEVGLGGRLDSTNIITPVLSVVTSIGLDHCALLGDTRAEIAGEKAGIFKPGVPALVGYSDEETAPVFRGTAARTGSPLFFADALRPLETEPLDLQGPCQEENLRTVRCALDLLAREDHAVGRALRGCSLEKMRTGWAHAALRTGLHGRWERVWQTPEVICDIGHNPPALRHNFQRLQGLHRPLFIVYGIMADKDLEGIAPLMPPKARYYLTAPATPRALPEGTLSARLRNLRPDLETETVPGVAEAVRKAMRDAANQPDALIYAGGSTFVVAEVMAALLQTASERP